MNMPKMIRLCLFLIIVMPAVPTRSDAIATQHAQPHVTGVPGSDSEEPAQTEHFAPIEPPLADRTNRHLGLAALGLMMTTLGAYWRIHQGSIGRRRWHRMHRTRAASRYLQLPGPAGPQPGSAAPHRMRRFDYDRFYLHMLRNL